MTYKLSLSPNIFRDAFAAGICTTMAEVKYKTGLNYQTVMKLTRGLFAPQFFRILAAYLECLGYTPERLAAVKFTDIFEIRPK
jgi:hypothetical protein